MAQKNKWLQRTLLASALMMAGPLNSAYAAVVTSIRPLGFIASAIADGVTSTEVLLPDGASPHDFALRPSDIQRLRAADLVVWVGPDMEAFLTKSLTPVSANRQLAISELSGVKPLLMKGDDDDHGDEHAGDAHNHADHGEDDGHHHGEYNMHVWLSPEVAKVTAIAIHDRLLELMPQNKDKLDANLRQFENLLTQTDKNVGNMLRPVQGKGYFVFHDAYGYFEKHFGLSPMGHFTVNPEIQPGAQRLHQIRTQLVEQKAVCVFAEPQFRPAVINAVAKGTKVRSGTLDPLGTGIALGKDSYGIFLTQLSNQYVSCLK
ncbi:zinc ABC transporter substrate-binding protein ZnuA [Serratia plymuthica]|uniref:High-affinity zinc uptake system protein ZnuA n=1 Tax=Serratia plymuthica TaxID=82996 RepID=A0A2X4V147_SERPL|nr:zinc ABC transporter substrate-binding protein ZnuA [Serratia plymuthica]QPS20510.1 zinc ABC transporter substrate-binding protein ZnuA [Serratia plymuthica]QPS62123.1 zinc ABC transporter substrate-binding protein ZnuA [Serratia plymuthica]RKS65598.1 zinc transport system substrate-binding protein [Serratia plymuthica]CAI2515682.1 High-affinity zinc uptake system protein znuA precursor [Serratia plymuthica]SQI41878.1 High-affinity zinc uptake system protein znuA precursor [Serratia plymuth